MYMYIVPGTIYKQKKTNVPMLYIHKELYECSETIKKHVIIEKQTKSLSRAISHRNGILLSHVKFLIKSISLRRTRCTKTNAEFKDQIVGFS